MPNDETPSVASKVEAIYAEAERSAASLREEIVEGATRRATETEEAANRHAAETVEGANRRATETEEAANALAKETVEAASRRATEVRTEAEAQAAQYLADCRARIDAFAEQRIRRLTELTDELIEQAEALQDRFEAADTVKRQLYDLVAGLGRTAEALAREHAQADAALPATPATPPVSGPIRATRGAPPE
jgi:hypothetical protein